MPRWAGFDFSGYAIEPFIQESAQGPAGAVTREHVQIVDVQVSLTVCLTDGFGVHMAEPVVGNHLARAVQNQSAQRVALVGIGLDAPVLAVQIFGNGADDVQLSSWTRCGFLGSHIFHQNLYIVIFRIHDTIYGGF